MSDPDRPPEDEPGGAPATPRRRVTRAALLQPRGLLVLAIGAFFFAASREWWVVPLTLATYASLVLLTAMTPARQTRAPVEAGGSHSQSSRRAPEGLRPSPEQRVTRLPQGETRRRAEAALEAHGRVLVAVEASDDVGRATLSRVAARLNRTADLLLDLAEGRESADEEFTSLRQRGARPGVEPVGGGFSSRLTKLEKGLEATDAELSGAPEKLLAFRKEVVRVSIESGDAAAARAEKLAESFNAWNVRLDDLARDLASPNR